jgi:hypothetical protein
LIGVTVSLAMPDLLARDIGKPVETWRDWLQAAAACSSIPGCSSAKTSLRMDAWVVLPGVVLAASALAVAFWSVNRRDIRWKRRSERSCISPGVGAQRHSPLRAARSVSRPDTRSEDRAVAGVLGANGAGKTTLLRMLIGCLSPVVGDVRIGGFRPRDAMLRTSVAYFAGGATLPPHVRSAAWGTLGNGEAVLSDRRRIRALSQGMKQLLGLRTVLSRHPLQLIVLDEPWEGTRHRELAMVERNPRIQARPWCRRRGVVASPARSGGLLRRIPVLLPHEATLMKAHEIARVGPVTATLLTDTFDKLRDRTNS